MDDRLLTIATLAPILGLSPRTLRNKLCADPSSLPPRVKVPGTRGPRWRMSDVQAWLNALPLNCEPDLPVPARRPGRRRKAV
jgi:predicted DNA-binding transcriptional regulator AlpA